MPQQIKDVPSLHGTDSYIWSFASFSLPDLRVQTVFLFGKISICNIISEAFELQTVFSAHHEEGSQLACRAPVLIHCQAKRVGRPFFFPAL